MRWSQILPLFAGLASALTPEQWRSQSIYQVLTDRFALTNGSTTQACSLSSYCGGTWQGIINKLDYIRGMGFTAVWISPVVKNLENSAYGRPYHGYWATDLYSLNPAFGTEADLKALSSALHTRGMYLMVDVVANHMGYAGAPGSVQYNTFNPFNSSAYYHPYCSIDYSNSTSAQLCWMGDTTVSLPDLKTEDPAVQNGLNQWIAQLVANYSIDGLRLDSAMQTNQQFWPGFLTASGVYAVGEVFNGNPYELCSWQDYMPGVLNYATYFWIQRAFQSTTATMKELTDNIQLLNGTCRDTTLLGSFLENHDNPRWATYTTDVGLTKNAVAITFLMDGIPIVYYGQEQSFSGAVDPYNREALWPSGYNTKSTLYTFIGALNAARKVAIAKDSSYASLKSRILYSDTQTLVLRKGSSANGLISLFTNRGTGSSSSVTVPAAKSGITANTKYTDLLTCDTFASDTSGNLLIKITSGQPRALFVSSGLNGSDVCAYTNSAYSAAVSTSTADSTSIKTVSTTFSQSTTSSIRASTTTTKATSSSTTSSCSVPSAVNIIFNQNVTTARGESVGIVGSISQLGTWDTSKALALSSANYPIWGVTVSIPSGTYFEYKFIKWTGGGVAWETGNNRVYTTPRSCGKSVTVALQGNWQG